MKKLIITFKDSEFTPKDIGLLKEIIGNLSVTTMKTIDTIIESDTNETTSNLKDSFELEQEFKRCTDCKHYEISSDDLPCNKCEYANQFEHK